MAPAEKTESTLDATGAERGATHHEGLNSGSGRGFASPLLGDDADRAAAAARPARGRTNFASAGGWVVSQ